MRNASITFFIYTLSPSKAPYYVGRIYFIQIYNNYDIITIQMIKGITNDN